MSVLSDLFTDIAGAIRGKTGEESTMKPIDFPAKIAGITTGDTGGTGVAPKPGEWCVKEFNFTPDDNEEFIYHRCYVVPDIIVIDGSFLPYLETYPDGLYLAKTIGFSSRLIKHLTNNGEHNLNYYFRNLLIGKTISTTGELEFQCFKDGVNYPIEQRDHPNITSCNEEYFVIRTNIGNLVTDRSYSCTCFWFTGNFDQVVVNGVPDFVKYATFMDGDVELYKMPFIKNFDCPNPITEGLIETPTKETTVSTIYTYSGWDNDLTDLTEDVIVNATYTESTRYYTVTFFDEDGTTVLNTMQVAYGETPSYTPSKTGYTFNGWTTELVPVTGDTSYIASWQAAVYFASSDWSAIAAVSEAGQAREYFNVGDSRTELVTIDGASSNVVFKIIGFNHDDLSDGSGKAGMTIAMFQFPSKIDMYYHSEILSSSGDTTGRSYANSQYKSYVDHVKSYFSSSLQNVIKEVNKEISYINSTPNSSCVCELFPLSTIEAGMTKATGYQASSKHIGTCYELFEKYSHYGNNNNSYTRICPTVNPTNYKSYYVIFRDAYAMSSTTMYYPFLSCSNNTFYNGMYNPSAAQNRVAGLAFCI